MHDPALHVEVSAEAKLIAKAIVKGEAEPCVLCVVELVLGCLTKCLQRPAPRGSRHREEE